MLVLWLALLLAGMWLLRQGPRQARALVVAGLIASGLWMMQAARAQVLDLQFTSADGETLAIPVNQIDGGGLEGFQRVDYRNSSPISLRIAAIVEPDFDACFPTGLDEPLPAPSGSSGTACSVGLTMAPGETCRVDVDAICRALADAAVAEITVAPLTVSFVEGGSGVVTITTDAGSPVPALNPQATIPGGSDLSIQSSTCGASLAPGASCIITFTSATQEGPTAVPIAGDNTDTATVTVSVTSQPQIAISGPVQQSRVIAVGGASLSLQVTNDAGSAANATGITVTNLGGAADVVVDDTDCVSVAPGASCTLELSSSTPYAPGTISIGGSNTANTPTTLVAFSYLGGLVFEESGGSGKVVIDVTQGFTSQWTATFVDLAGASSPDTGAANTDAIVVDAACTNAPGNCAAQRCRNISADWYLPARNELLAVSSALCSNGAIPCNAGGFDSSFHWSSTSLGAPSALGALFPGQPVLNGKLVSAQVRCVRAF